jgi:hypothetical protein
VSAPDKVRSVLRELEVHRYDLLYQVTPAGKPHAFTLRVRDVTLNGCTTRAIIRAIRRTFSKSVVA